MSTFTQQVELISEFLVLPGKAPASISKVAKHLKVNDSTLRNALKADSPESPYTGSLAEVVLEAWKLVPGGKGKKPRGKKSKTPARGRLHGLVRANDKQWTAQLGEAELTINRQDDGSWLASDGKTNIAARTTFKGIIGDLRNMARNA